MRAIRNLRHDPPSSHVSMKMSPSAAISPVYRCPRDGERRGKIDETISRFRVKYGAREYVMDRVEITSGCFDPAPGSIHSALGSHMRGDPNESVEEIRFIGSVPGQWGITVETTGDQTHELDLLVIKTTAIRKTCWAAKHQNRSNL